MGSAFVGRFRVSIQERPPQFYQARCPSRGRQVVSRMGQGRFLCRLARAKLPVAPGPLKRMNWASPSKTIQIWGGRSTPACFRSVPEPCQASQFRLFKGRSLDTLPQDLLLSENYYNPKWSGFRRLKNTCVAPLPEEGCAGCWWLEYRTCENHAVWDATWACLFVGGPTKYHNMLVFVLVSRFKTTRKKGYRLQRIGTSHPNLSFLRFFMLFVRGICPLESLKAIEVQKCWLKFWLKFWYIEI